MKFNVNFENLSEKAQSAAKQKTVVVRSGDPKVTFSSTRNKMAISSGALQLMDFNKKEDTIVMYDFGKEFEEVNGFRFAVSKGYIKDGEVIGATVANGNQFNYSGIWANGMFPDVDFDPTTKTVQQLVERGLLTADENGLHAKSNEIVRYDLVEAKDEDDNVISEVPVDMDSEGNHITVKLYPMIYETRSPLPVNEVEDDE